MEAVVTLQHLNKKEKNLKRQNQQGKGRLKKVTSRKAPKTGGKGMGKGGVVKRENR